MNDEMKAYMRAVARWAMEGFEDDGSHTAKDDAWDRLTPADRDAANRLVDDVFGDLL